jgi:hypothetical protein
MTGLGSRSLAKTGRKQIRSNKEQLIKATNGADDVRNMWEEE